MNGTHAFTIQQLAIEKSGPGQTNPSNVWQKTVYDVSDPTNQGFGDVTFWVVVGNVGPRPGNFTQRGGAHIRARAAGS